MNVPQSGRGDPGDRFGRDEILGLLDAGLEAVEPGRLVRRALEGGESELRAARGVAVLSIGKAAAAMAEAAAEILGGAVVAGVVVAPAVGPSRRAGFEHYAGGHPLPDEGSVAAAGAVERLVDGLSNDERVLCLLSGGGSSLVAAPIGDVTLADLRRAFALLLESGAAIDEVNVVRRHLTRLSGGRLARRVPGRITTLALSDVPGDRPETIASGPTVSDPSTFDDARGVLVRHGLWARVPAAVRRVVEQGTLGASDETLKPGDPALTGSRFLVVGSGDSFVEAAALRAVQQGASVVRRAAPMAGEARFVGAAIGRELCRLTQAATAATVWLAAGETTVTVRGAGSGGRNQEAALAAALELEGESGAAVAFFATDGVDGPTDAAGALVDGGTVRRIREAGLDGHAALAANDSHSALRASGDLLIRGATGTNVADVVVGFLVPR
ncbi:MAG: glycerate kinase [Candidatus Bipolaricaulia bacterium]